MITTLKILEEITTGYTIFEKDQVLTENQLNRVTDYLNDQNRLTRVNLLGVGVAAGLQVSRSGDTVHLTEGLGITTDGDLLYYHQDLVFDRFIIYGNSYPRYTPFYVGGDVNGAMLPVYELILQGATDTRNSIFPLSNFTTETTGNLDDMVAILLMESYVNDPDICTGTDCDNLGQNCINTPKLLLVGKTSINALLQPTIATPQQAYYQLSSIVPDRPNLPLNLSSASGLAQIYRTACASIHTKLLTELAKIYPNCGAFITDVFPADPITDWTTRLTALQTTANVDLIGQYYYDFLKDVVATYNEFWQLLFGDSTWCCPEISWFPKHLLLGNLVPGSNLAENRTGFYPSPIVSKTATALNHAKFLLQKLDNLIKTFQVPTPTPSIPIRITPSLFADQPLEARAIPYYYLVNQAHPLHQQWSYQRHQQGLDAFNYSYHASIYNAQGGAINPLISQIEQFDFLRIEGHLGQNLNTAFSAISESIKSHNLPFAVLKVSMNELSQSSDMTFSNLLSQHSELEHFGGVLRGGTFVLLADGNNDTIIADFMLPYWLTSQSSSGICTLALKPGDNLANRLSSIADGQDAHICLQQGTYNLTAGLQLQNKGHLTITGSGQGTRIIAPGIEAVMEFLNCRSVSMSNCYLENSVNLGAGTTGFAKNTPDLKGVLTFVNCPNVELEKLTLRCAHQVVRAASCITVRQDLAVLNTQVRIRHCDLEVGYQQIGILLVNVDRSQVEDNKIQVDTNNLAATFSTLSAKSEYRLRLLPYLISNAYLGNGEPRNRPNRLGLGITSLRFRQCNVPLVVGNQIIRFKTDPIFVNQWQPLIDSRNLDVGNRQGLLAAAKKLARQILLDDTFRTTLPVFNNWYQTIQTASTIIAAQGIVVAGTRAREVRILNNTIRGCLQGIHIGISPRITAKAGSVLLTGNRIEVAAPADQLRERHGIYVSSCESLIIENNYLQAVTGNLSPSIEGIHISGRLGRMVIIRQNYLAGFKPHGIYFNPLDNIYGSGKMQWLVADNMAPNIQIFMKVVSNLPGTQGSQVVAKVVNNNNFQ
jgi:hypothetical protein